MKGWDGTEQTLKAKGFVQDASGGWYKPGNDSAVAGLSKPDTKRHAKSSGKDLVSNEAEKGRSKRMEERPVVTITSFRQRTLTDATDSFAAGNKYLRDAIARSLGIDDADKFIEWKYYQIKVGKKSEEGTLVKIEL